MVVRMGVGVVERVRAVACGLEMGDIVLE